MDSSLPFDPSNGKILLYSSFNNFLNRSNTPGKSVAVFLCECVVKIAFLPLSEGVDDVTRLAARCKYVKSGQCAGYRKAY